MSKPGADARPVSFETTKNIWCPAERQVSMLEIARPRCEFEDNTADIGHFHAFEMHLLHQKWGLFLAAQTAKSTDEEKRTESHSPATRALAASDIWHQSRLSVNSRTIASAKSVAFSPTIASELCLSRSWPAIKDVVTIGRPNAPASCTL